MPVNLFVSLCTHICTYGNVSMGMLVYMSVYVHNYAQWYVCNVDLCTCMNIIYTRMVYLYYIPCLRYTILVGNPRNLNTHAYSCTYMHITHLFPLYDYVQRSESTAVVELRCLNQMFLFLSSLLACFQFSLAQGDVVVFGKAHTRSASFLSSPFKAYLETTPMLPSLHFTSYHCTTLH